MRDYTVCAVVFIVGILFGIIIGANVVDVKYQNGIKRPSNSSIDELKMWTNETLSGDMDISNEDIPMGKFIFIGYVIWNEKDGRIVEFWNPFPIKIDNKNGKIRIFQPAHTTLSLYYKDK